MRSNQRRQKESDASRLPLLQTTGGGGNTLGLVHFGGVAGRLEGIAGSGQGLEVCLVLFVGLESREISKCVCMVDRNWVGNVQRERRSIRRSQSRACRC